MALVALLIGVKGLETGLGMRGFKAGVVDSESLWLKERARADDLGRRALILVGDSRMQLDADQEVLGLETGLEPVQLAIDGTPFQSVFEGLAKDPDVTGTVMVDFAETVLMAPRDSDLGDQYEADAEMARRQFSIPDFTTVDADLSSRLHGTLRSYADGGRPLTALTQRLLQPDVTPQYLTTLPDRSVVADYSMVKMPYFYYQRVFRNLGEPMTLITGKTVAQANALLDKQMAALRPMDNSYFRSQIHDIAAMTAAITARGGRVIFVRFPESGYVKEIDDRRYPRTQFWDLFAAEVGTQTLNSEDDPALAGFICPDGSHLDYHQRPGFTNALVNAIHMRQDRNPNGH